MNERIVVCKRRLFPADTKNQAMNIKLIYKIAVPAVLMSIAGALCAGDLPQAQVYTTGSWLSFGCRTLDTIADYTVNTNNLEFSKYGGWKARRIDQGTGFFRVEQIN